MLSSRTSSDLVESGSLNRLLIRNARKSPKEISALTGIDAKEVTERLGNLLGDRMWRDERMEERLLLAEAALGIEDLRAKMDSEDVSHADYATLSRVLLQHHKTLIERMDKNAKIAEGELAKINRAQAALMVGAIQLAMERASFELEKRYPEVDSYEIMQVFEAELPIAVAHIEKNVAG